MKDKEIVKKTVNKKIFENILFSYRNSSIEISNLKDLFKLALEEKNEDIIKDCNLKIDTIQVI